MFLNEDFLDDLNVRPDSVKVNPDVSRSVEQDDYRYSLMFNVRGFKGKISFEDIEKFVSQKNLQSLAEKYERVMESFREIRRYLPLSIGNGKGILEWEPFPRNINAEMMYLYNNITFRFHMDSEFTNTMRAIYFIIRIYNALVCHMNGMFQIFDNPKRDMTTPYGWNNISEQKRVISCGKQ